MHDALTHKNKSEIIAINNLSWKLLLLWELLATTTAVATRDQDAGWF